ncbi:chemotaxis protein CheW [Leptospira idonii]|uniref:Chemotaxis protein CheW n=1 Tax=Leptospira idonii TaxID=1193500 RepID=A0A4R9LXM6_9LEPT|nr:chemotaxis protein CheW [Leptospira idonii]TGN18321.1 chemotaxis protein CheW [Leptospira idonii]
MAENTDWLLFEIRDRYFALKAQFVREILWFLPLTPTTLGSKGIFATFPLRGEIIPVFDLFFSWGAEPSPYKSSYQLLLLDSGMALPITNVLEVISWEDPKKEIHPDSTGAWEERVWKNKVVSLLHPHMFLPLEQRENGDLSIAEEGDSIQLVDTKRKNWDEFFLPGEENSKLNWHNLCYSIMSESEHKEVNARKDSYTALATVIETGGMEPISIVKVSEESYGISLDAVLEFSDPSHLTPLPGVTNLLVGCMNLRGEVLPVLGLDQILGNQTDRPYGFGKVVIIKEDSQQFGILVDELVDVVYKKEEDRRPPPLGTRDLEGMIQSSYKHGDGFINLLNISTILKRTKQELH